MKPTDAEREDFAAMTDAALEPADFPENALGELSDEEHEAALEAWRIDGARTAAWALRRYRRAAADVERAVGLADELRAQADEYEAQVKARANRDLTYFEGRLRFWHAVETDGRKTKTVELPGGKLTARKGSVRAIVEDEKAAVEWLEDHAPDAIVYRDPTVDKAKIKTAFGTKVDAELPGQYPAVDAETGEVVPGVSLERGEPSFTVTLTDLEEGAGDDAA